MLVLIRDPSCSIHTMQAGLWRTMWNATVPQQAAEQKPLMDAQLEGERALHHLETAAPVAVLDQLLSTAAAAAAPLLSACPGGQLPSSVALLDSCVPTTRDSNMPRWNGMRLRSARRFPGGLARHVAPAKGGEIL